MLIISKKFGRLGNNIYQLLNIISEALHQKDNIDLKQLYHLSPIINIRNIETQINLLFPNKNQVIRHHFMPKDLHLVDKRTVDIQRFFDIGEKYIYPNFNCNIKPLDDRTCLIHLRSGDIFSRGGAHPSYIQPPLVYYKKIIQDFNNEYDKFIIITEHDGRNPCIKLLNGYMNKVNVTTNSVFEDYRTLLKAQSIILSRSSFSDSTIFINPNIKNIYFWSYGHNLCNTNIIPKRINVFPHTLTKKYIGLGEWTGSPEQLEQMIHYKMDNVSMV